MRNAKTLVAVHTHTHTHTSNFINEKLYIKYKEIKVDMQAKHVEKVRV